MLRVDDGAPVEVTVFQTVDQDFGGGDVGGNRNVVDIADAQQVHLIGLIGLGADGVAEEEQHVHLFTGDARYDLLGAAMAAGEKFCDLQSGVLLDQTAGGAGRQQTVLFQNMAVSIQNCTINSFLAS